MSEDKRSKPYFKQPPTVHFALHQITLSVAIKLKLFIASKLPSRPFQPCSQPAVTRTPHNPPYTTTDQANKERSNGCLPQMQDVVPCQVKPFVRTKRTAGTGRRCLEKNVGDA
jgi:hypothetical protein